LQLNLCNIGLAAINISGTVMTRINLFTALFSLIVFLFCISSCSTNHGVKETSLFTQLDSLHTGVSFNNQIIETEEINPLQYENSYSGGGVAIGDLNNDGLDDIYFTGNVVPNKLFLNKGNFRFEDCTLASGVQGNGGWKTGVSLVDINGDSLLDIYVCRSGDFPGDLRANELFINKGNNKEGIPVFKEEAKLYGLADSAYSIQSAFFDYDKDGDLDLLLINNCPVRFNNLDETSIKNLLSINDPRTGNKLYKNDNGFFKDVTVSSGIRQARLNYSLGVSIADINNDGWADIYISNDYLSPDYLYINNGNGTFKDSISSMLPYTSQFSMGNDIADINNDGLPDIVTLDMLPEDNKRQKILFAADNYELFDLDERAGLHAQYMRNMLYMNNGNGSFSEVGQLAGISNTDWSWAPLFADFDMDGYKDLFISNGFVRDYTNMDFLKFLGDNIRDLQGNVTKKTLLDLVQSMPSSNVKNYAFKNNLGSGFINVADKWGLSDSSNSNGASYADLDNDGDLDLVVNNINSNCLLYRNNADTLLKKNYLRVKLVGENKNTLGIGSTITVYTNQVHQVQQQLISKGFQSSVSPTLLFGIDTYRVIDSLKIIWPSGKKQNLYKIEANKEIKIYEKDAHLTASETGKTAPILTPVKSPVEFRHMENIVNDFKRQPLLLNSLSYSGPCIAKADINGDKKEDIFIGGAAGQSGSIFIQTTNGNFIHSSQPFLEADSLFEDVTAVFLDADKDGDADLFVGSGGYDNFLSNDKYLKSRLYINDGKGHYKTSANQLPDINGPVGCVAASDINGDGAIDLFIGGRSVPGNYPVASTSYILINNGKGYFSDETSKVLPAISHAGMFTDAVFCDMNNDNVPDLITIGEWMPIRVWINFKGELVDKTADYFEMDYSGWWNKLLVDDINSDGKPDLIVGNYGLNTQCKPSEKEPLDLYYKDFDGNGAVDPIFCFYIQGKSYPYVSRDELLEQMSIMRPRFPDYKSYENARLENIFTPEELENAKHLKANTLESMCLLSANKGKYKASPLPVEAQYSPVFAMQLIDCNNDGIKDLILGGNVSHAKVKFGRNEANFGMLFTADKNGKFNYTPQKISGLNVSGDVRFISTLRNNVILFGRNNNNLAAYKINRQ
jgi:hypothetical protein